MHNSLTLTIVIPVYNEQRYLGACLDSIAAQVTAADEVIVVDNNSTDRTITIAKSYPFVRVLSEKRQHQTFAQATGFNATKSDIIGRIDADTILPPDWVAKVKRAFECDDGLVALTGGAQPYDVASQKLASGIFKFYTAVSSAVAGTRMLWGANCAILTSAWHETKDQTIKRADIWEDYDMAFCLSKVGRVSYEKGIAVGTSFRAVHQPLIHQIQYQFRAIRTFYLREGFLKATLLGMIWISMCPIYPYVLFDSYILKPLLQFDRVRSLPEEL